MKFEIIFSGFTLYSMEETNQQNKQTNQQTNKKAINKTNISRD